MPQVLEVNNLYKTYGHGDIFRDVTFSLEGGETLGIFGMSGCGKSTLGRCITGLDKKFKGEVFFEGKSIKELSKKKNGLKRALVQMIFQHPEISFDPKKTVAEAITEPVYYHFGRKPKEVFKELYPLIEAVGLKPEQLYCYPDQLSGGEIQRAMMVKIYSLSPKLVVADEPTSMLDMSVQAQVLNLMKSLQEKRQNACIFISHDPGVMQLMCDRVAILEKGNFMILNKPEYKSYLDKFNKKFEI
ncbi:peptide/nickel transport system ATP-binding protein [Methanomicrobium sp. W14]|uniref:ABC transporter ATP-binding protein n=1 Tax=Methanomicrobium sp. W14 TaxID=2817839 RepID=UPI001AEAE83F|nr:dipeptide/oligopeptide/nickel ABC transporter ATP-binding protein [Methanomicrobium sp. W14]MBP2132686.1 peptide/nickel transport system ATP-binding protein [Methanomicrobium sp. W14]